MTFILGNHTSMVIATPVQSFYAPGVDKPVCLVHALAFDKKLNLQPAFEEVECPFCSRELTMTVKQLRHTPYVEPYNLPTKYKRRSCENYLSWEVAVVWHELDNDERVVNDSHALAAHILEEISIGNPKYLCAFTEVVAPYYMKGVPGQYVERFVREAEGNHPVTLTAARQSMRHKIAKFLVPLIERARARQAESGIPCGRLVRAEYDEIISDWIRHYIFKE